MVTPDEVAVKTVTTDLAECGGHGRCTACTPSTGAAAGAERAARSRSYTWLCSLIGCNCVRLVRVCARAKFNVSSGQGRPPPCRPARPVVLRRVTRTGGLAHARGDACCAQPASGAVLFQRTTEPRLAYECFQVRSRVPRPSLAHQANCWRPCGAELSRDSDRKIRIE